jgi:hypothetical protein
MPDEDNKDLAVANPQPMVRTEKKFIGPGDVADAELEPLFANHFELTQIGSDIFLDIGVVRAGDFISLKEKMASSPGDVHSITFNVLQRIVMSLDGFARLRSTVEQVSATMRGGTVAGG